MSEEKQMTTEEAEKKIKHHIGQAIARYRTMIHDYERNIPQGFHRKRSGYDRLIDKNLLNTDFVYQEYPLILMKQSKLPASERAVIKEIGYDAQAHFILEEKQKNEKK